MIKIAVLGAGMVGRTIATDLSAKYLVTVFDKNSNQLALVQTSNQLITKEADLKHTEYFKDLLAPFDLVVCAVPGFMGYNTLKGIIECGKDVVDISFFSEDARNLDALAKQNNVRAIIDCGVAPGMSNLILGYYDSIMKIDEFECMVGGLPKKRSKPFEYKAPFSPIDVIEEYTRPARYVENGFIVTKPALSDAELIEFDGIGTLESFNTDGLRSILFNMPHIPNMKEKTLRYPGHIDIIKSLLKAGFFETNPVELNGNSVRPIDLTTAILFNQWKLLPEESEFTVMKIIMKGKMNNIPTTIEYNLYDEFDKATKTASMSRTTGYTCTAAVNVLLEGLFTETGVFPPELMAKKEGCFDFIMQYLADRKVNYDKKITQ